MSVLEEVLIEEYDRSMRILREIEAEQMSLPKGSVRKKLIKGRPYYYLQYRDGDRVKSEYIKEQDLESVKAAVNKYKENIVALKELRKSIKQIEKALGKDAVSEYSAERIS